MTTQLTESQLRNQLESMTIEQMIELRDSLENNWNESLRPLMMILSKGCYNKFGKLISSL